MTAESKYENVALTALDNIGQYFQKRCDNNVWELVDCSGTKIAFGWRFNSSDTPFVWYAKDRVLASKDGKYGFVSIDGFITIPFKYDLIEPREDGLFNVRIGEAWGIMNLDGFEITKIKYVKRIPPVFNNVIVEDVLTQEQGCVKDGVIEGRKGVINNRGSEIVPCIYDELFFSKDNSFIFFGYGDGLNDIYYETNIAWTQFGTGFKWGIMDSSGREIIKPIYDCFLLKDGFLLAGRNGNTWGRNKHCKIEDLYDYYGVFDLYDLSGNMIIGGFNFFEYNFEKELYCFQFGLFWEHEMGGEDGYGVYHHLTYRCDETESRWLILNKELSSVKNLQNGDHISFDEGFTVEIKRTKHHISPIDYINDYNSIDLPF